MNDEKEKEDVVYRKEKKPPSKAALKKIKQREYLEKIMAETKQQSSKLIVEGKIPPLKTTFINPDYNSDRTKNIRFAYCEYYRKHEKKGPKIYFIDECLISNLIESKTDEFKDSENFSLIAILSCDGNAFWKIRYSSGKKYEDLTYIRELCNTVIENEKQNKPEQNDVRRILILDSVIMKE